MLVVLACLMAPLPGHFQGVFTYIQMIWGFISPGVVAVFLFGVVVRRAPTAAAWAGLTLGVPLYGLLLWAWPHVAFLNHMALTFILLVGVMGAIAVAWGCMGGRCGRGGNDGVVLGVPLDCTTSSKGDPVRRIMPLLALLLLPGCARMRAPTFPSAVRPPLVIQGIPSEFYPGLLAMLENRGLPIVVDDPQFGIIRSDWVNWDEGKVDVRVMADCPVSPNAPPGKVRARFGFDIRQRTVQSSVTILSHWQIEKVPSLDNSDRGFVDCRSTGEWERMVEGTLTNRNTIR